MLNILFCGDVVGKSGRSALKKYLPVIQKDNDIHTTIVNAENAAGGFGITEKICEDIFNLNVQAITLGNHSFDKEEIKLYLPKVKNVLRPYNYNSQIGEPYYTYICEDLKITVVNLLGKLFMHSRESFKDPFIAINEFLQEIKLKENSNIIFVDFHAETTSEKNAMGHYLDGKVTAVIGTHTHIPTYDCRILPKGTAYQTDVGMCGDYDSVIGMIKEASLSLFLKQPNIPLAPALGEGTLCATIIQVNKKTGLVQRIYNIKKGGCLEI